MAITILESVVAFADCADRLTLTSGPELSLRTIGPLAESCGEIADNLVLKAARLLAERVNDLKVGEFTLEKVLPVAAGIGGGWLMRPPRFGCSCGSMGSSWTIRACAMSRWRRAPTCRCAWPPMPAT